MHAVSVVLFHKILTCLPCNTIYNVVINSIKSFCMYRPLPGELHTIVKTCLCDIIIAAKT